MRVFWFN